MGDETDLPWMKFYPSDFMGSPKVRSMTGLQRGIYISLICKCWQSPGGAIPDDPDELWMECGVTPEQMEDAWPKVRRCFEPHPERDGYVVNPRVQEERELALERRERARKAGKASGEARAGGSTGRSTEGSTDRSTPRSTPRSTGRSTQGSTMRASDASEAQSPDGAEDTEVTDVQTEQPSEDVKSSGASAAVENPRDGNRWSETVTACRKHLWLADDPPFDRTVGQELSVAKQLTERWNLGPPEVAEAVEGFAMLREQGEWSGWVEPKDPASLLALNRTPDDSQGIPVMIRSLHEVRKAGPTERSGDMERVSA